MRKNIFFKKKQYSIIHNLLEILIRIENLNETKSCD